MKASSKNLDPWFVTGFCEGEGTFTFSRSGTHVSLYFAIKLTKTDHDLLKKLNSFFGVGKIYNVKPLVPGKYSGHTKSAVYYRTTKLSELEKIIQHFENYPLRGEKYKRYSCWKELVWLKKKNFKRPRWPKDDFDKYLDLLQELSNLAPKNIPWDGGDDHY